jgi:hypothetical protein
MEISRSPALAGMVRELYQAMGSGDADAAVTSAGSSTGRPSSWPAAGGSRPG